MDGPDFFISTILYKIHLPTNVLWSIISSSVPQQNYGHFFNMLWVLLMEVTFIFHHQYFTRQPTKTERDFYHRTAMRHCENVSWPWNSRTSWGIRNLQHYQHYWWLGLCTLVKNYVHACQQFKIDRHPSKPAFLPMEGAKSTRPFAHCSMDLITDLPLLEGFDSILVVVNQGFSKGVILMPCNKTITSEGTAKLLLDILYKQFGLPDKIISDRGPQFTSKAFQELMKQLGINSALSTAYHPQMDGTTEQVNQEIKAYLSIYCTSHLEEWSTVLHTLEFTHNNRRHAERQKTPFKLMFGDSPIAIPVRGHHSPPPITPATSDSPRYIPPHKRP